MKIKGYNRETFNSKKYKPGGGEVSCKLSVVIRTLYGVLLRGKNILMSDRSQGTHRKPTLAKDPNDAFVTDEGAIDDKPDDDQKK